MTNENFKHKVHALEAYYKSAMRNIREDCEEFNDIDVIIPKGIYKGRRGMISHAHMSSSGLIGLIQPYRLRGDLNSFLNTTCDARTFWNLSDITKILD